MKKLRAADRDAIVGRLELGYSYEQLALTLKKATPEVTNFALVRQIRERVAARLAERRKDDVVAGRPALTQEARQAFAAEMISPRC